MIMIKYTIIICILYISLSCSKPDTSTSAHTEKPPINENIALSPENTTEQCSELYFGKSQESNHTIDNESFIFRLPDVYDMGDMICFKLNLPSGWSIDQVGGKDGQFMFAVRTIDENQKRKTFCFGDVWWGGLDPEKYVGPNAILIKEANSVKIYRVETSSKTIWIKKGSIFIVSFNIEGDNETRNKQFTSILESIDVF